MSKGGPQWQFFGGPGSWGYRTLDALRRWLNRRLVDYLARRALGGRGAVVLEAGSGPASGASFWAARSDVTLSVAVDIDATALAEASHRDPDLCLVLADIRRLPFATGCSDLVWNSSTLEHLPDREMALAEMTRVAKSGGHVFVGVPNRYGPLGIQRWIPATGLGEWIGPVFGAADLSAMCVRLGLQPVAARAYFFGVFVGVLARKPTIASSK